MYLSCKLCADDRGTFQHDHILCHNSKLTKNFTQENNANVLDWPGNSPDLNPIKYLWRLVKRRVGKIGQDVQQSAVD